MARTTFERWTCDLCGSDTTDDPGKCPIGWHAVSIKDSIERDDVRHICPFCWEMLEEMMEQTKRKGGPA